jgi:predicted nucleotide-binding protein
MPFHIGIPLLGRVTSLGFYLLNIDEETLLEYFVKPYRAGDVITWQGTWIQPNQISSISIYETEEAIEGAGGGSPGFGVYATQGINRTNDFIGGPPGYARPAADPVIERARDPRRVMIVHGRNGAALNAMRAFLSSLGLEPILWEDAVEQTGTASPHNLDAVAAAMALAQAVIVIFTAEDEARLLDALVTDHDGPEERELRGQPRANVFLEAGMALAIDRDHTILTRLGSFRGASDVDGLNAVGLSNGAPPRSALRRRLTNARCQVNDRDDYLEPAVAGDFDAAVAWASIQRSRSGRARRSGVASRSRTVCACFRSSSELRSPSTSTTPRARAANKTRSRRPTGPNAMPEAAPRAVDP